MQAAEPKAATTRQALEALATAWESPLSRRQRTELEQLIERLDRLQERVVREVNLVAGELLLWLVDVLGYLKHFDDYFGQGETSEDRKRTVLLSCDYARRTGLNVVDFVSHVEKLDPTLGKPEEQQIVITTVFRTKGLQYDYVIIPSCEEGYMPCLIGTGNSVFDKAGLVTEPEPSKLIENERRLFYVSITRARKGLHIGASVAPTRGSRGRPSPSRPSRFLHEVQQEPTVALMTALQRVAAGQQEARAELQRAAAQHGGVRALVHNLVTEYLPDIKEHDLAAEVQRLAAAVPVLPFSYPQAYESSLPAIASEADPTWSDNEPPWWESEKDW